MAEYMADLEKNQELVNEGRKRRTIQKRYNEALGIPDPEPLLLQARKLMMIQGASFQPESHASYDTELDEEDDFPVTYKSFSLLDLPQDASFLSNSGASEDTPQDVFASLGQRTESNLELEEGGKSPTPPEELSKGHDEPSSPPVSTPSSRATATLTPSNTIELVNNYIEFLTKLYASTLLSTGQKPPHLDGGTITLPPPANQIPGTKYRYDADPSEILQGKHLLKFSTEPNAVAEPILINKLFPDKYGMRRVRRMEKSISQEFSNSAELYHMSGVGAHRVDFPGIQTQLQETVQAAGSSLILLHSNTGSPTEHNDFVEQYSKYYSEWKAEPNSEWSPPLQENFNWLNRTIMDAAGDVAAEIREIVMKVETKEMGKPLETIKEDLVTSLETIKSTSISNFLEMFNIDPKRTTSTPISLYAGGTRPKKH